eukprot:m.113391 g.113391  ORF g.113391 m.113391 type:complete len:629 (-) comp10800_c0_seq2:3332-5218(-)
MPQVATRRGGGVSPEVPVLAPPRSVAFTRGGSKPRVNVLIRPRFLASFDALLEEVSDKLDGLPVKRILDPDGHEVGHGADLRDDCVYTCAESVALMGHSNVVVDRKRSLARIMETQLVPNRVITVYGNGVSDAAGHRIVLSKRTAPTYDRLLDLIGKLIPLQGGVRKLYTLPECKLVRGLPLPEDATNFIAVGTIGLNRRRLPKLVGIPTPGSRRESTDRGSKRNGVLKSRSKGRRLPPIEDETRGSERRESIQRSSALPAVRGTDEAAHAGPSAHTSTVASTAAATTSTTTTTSSSDLGGNSNRRRTVGGMSHVSSSSHGNVGSTTSVAATNGNGGGPVQGGEAGGVHTTAGEVFPGDAKASAVMAAAEVAEAAKSTERERQRQKHHERYLNRQKARQQNRDNKVEQVAMAADHVGDKIDEERARQQRALKARIDKRGAARERKGSPSPPPPTTHDGQPIVATTTPAIATTTVNPHDPLTTTTEKEVVHGLGGQPSPPQPSHDDPARSNTEGDVAGSRPKATPSASDTVSTGDTTTTTAPLADSSNVQPTSPVKPSPSSSPSPHDLLKMKRIPTPDLEFTKEDEEKVRHLAATQIQKTYRGHKVRRTLGIVPKPSITAAAAAAAART